MSSKWTNKLINKAAKLSRKESSDSQADGAVNDFLYGAGGPPPPSLNAPKIQSQTLAQAQYAPPTRLDLEDNDNGLGEPLPDVNPAYALPSPRKGKGIHVGFTEERPAIIGEGGDEAELPTKDVASTAHLLSPTSTRSSDAPQVHNNNADELHLSPVEAPTIAIDRAPTTSARKQNVGPGWLQKRRSFNMEEGQIQRQASNTDLASVAARQGFGASLDPNALQQEQRPIDPTPPPPLGAMEKLRQRHASPQDNIFQKVVHKAAHQNDPPQSEASKRWDQLLALAREQRTSPSSSANTSPQIPSGFQSQQPRDNLASPPPMASPPADAPPDAFAGSFVRGVSPNRPPMQMPPSQQSAYRPGEHLVESPSSNEYSPLSNTIDRLLGPTQDISLKNPWDQREAQKGPAPARPPPPPSHFSGSLNGFQQQLGVPLKPTGLRPSSRETNHPPPPARRPSHPDVNFSQASEMGPRQPNIDNRQPSLPVLPPHQTMPAQNVMTHQNMAPRPAAERKNSFADRSSEPPKIPAAAPPAASSVPPEPQVAAPLGPRPGPPPRPPPPSQEPKIPVLPPEPAPGRARAPSVSDHVRGRHNDAGGALRMSQTLGVPSRAPTSRSGSADTHVSSDRPSSSNGLSQVQELDASPAPSRGTNSPSPLQVWSPTRVPQSELTPPPGSAGYEPNRAPSTDDFRLCIDILQNCFIQAEQDARAIIRNNLAQWLRLAAWWNLKGRKAFEVRIKAHETNVAARSESVDESLKGPFIDVAKAWWIAERVIPNVLRDPRSDFSQPSDGLEGSALQQVYHTLKIQIETFIATVSRRRLLPSPQLLNVNFTSFFVQYPTLPTVVRALTSRRLSAAEADKPTDQPFFGIVLADTSRHFSYGHLFAETQVTLPHDDDDEDEDMILPCVISLIRDKTMSQMEMFISSQDGQISLRIRADGRGLPTWNEVELRPRSHSLRIQLPAEFNIIVRLEKDDFKTLWGIREYNKRVMEEWSPAKDERMIYETRLIDFNYIPPKGSPHPLPTNPIKDCAMRLYEKNDSVTNADRPLYRGHRMVVITSPDVKTLSSVSIPFDANFPLLHSLLRGEGGVPALLLHISQNQQPCRMIPAFRDPEDRNRFCEKLSGSYLAGDELNLGTMKVTNISVSTAVPGTPGNLLDIPGVQWTDIHILSKMENGVDPRQSDRFRITADSNVGRLVDRPIIKPGELKIGLDAMDLNSIKLRRSQDSSLIVALMENKLPTGLTAPLQDAFSKKSSAASTIRYQFPSMPDMHEFEEIVTGYRVLYDGVTSYFSIKGQLKAAGMHKKLESTRTRIQIVQEEKKNTLQLLAFFKDMPDGACMSFGLASTDNYELSHVSGKYYLRFIDARFGVPKPLSESDATFVSLDMPEFAGQRDDIMVGFDTEEDRDRFVEVLPAAASKASGLASFKRFVELGNKSNRPGSRASVQS